jgi:hypothetical protein
MTGKLDGEKLKSGNFDRENNDGSNLDRATIARGTFDRLKP